MLSSFGIIGDRWITRPRQSRVSHFQHVVVSLVRSVVYRNPFKLNFFFPFCVDRKYDEVDARNWASAISIANCKMRSSALKALMHVDFMAFDH